MSYDPREQDQPHQFIDGPETAPRTRRSPYAPARPAYVVPPKPRPRWAIPFTRQRVYRDAPSIVIGGGASMSYQQPQPAGPSRAVTKQRKKTSHGLHLVLTICTAGMWGLFVWLPITLWHKMGPKQKTVTRYR